MRWLIGLMLIFLSAGCSSTSESGAVPQRLPEADSADGPLKGGSAVTTAESGVSKALPREPKASDHEPNNGRDEATPLPFGAPLTGWINTLADTSEGDQDWFVVDVPGSEPSILSVTLKGPSDLDVVLEWMPSIAAGKRDKALIQADVIRKKAGDEILSNLRVSPGQTYLRVRAAWYRNKPRLGSLMPYSLRAELLPWAESIEAEPNDSLEDAVLGALERPARGTLGHAGDRDVWRFPVTEDAGTRLELKETGLPGVVQELSVRWQKIQGTTIRAKSKEGEGLSLRNLSVPDVEGPTLIVTLRALSGATPRVAYDLQLKPEASQGGAVEAEPNETPKTATPIMLGEKAHGFLDRKRDRDCFWFEVDAPMSGEFRLTPPMETKAGFDLISPDGVVVHEARGTARGAEISAFGIGLTTGRWTLRVTGSPVEARQSYTLLAKGTEAKANEREPNDEATHAPFKAITTAEPSVGWLHPAGDIDLWSLERRESEGPGIVTFQIDPPRGARLDVLVETLEGQEVTGRRGLTAGQPGTFTHFLQPGSYVLRVKGSQATSYATDPYQLRLLD